MRTLKVSVALGIVAVAIIAAQCAEIRDVRGNQRATLKLLEAESKAAAFTLDTIKARNAEREIGDQKHADSLRNMLSRFRRQLAAKGDVHSKPADSIQVAADVDSEPPIPIQDVLALCEECAARLDSAVLAARAEREAATLTVHALSVEKDHYRKEYDAIRRKRAWQSKLWPVALIGGTLLGAWVRGQ